MPLTDLSDWLDEYTRPGFLWYVKRLSGNDTLANRTHQAGPYIPKDFLFEILPELNRPGAENPDVWFELAVDSHPDRRDVRAVWYNNKNRGGTRNEARITNFGGLNSALLDPESTGALAVFVFRTHRPEGQAQECNVWVCDDALQEDLVEDRIGPVEPGKKGIVWSTEHAVLSGDLFPREISRTSCWLQPDEIPAAWLEKYPAGAEIIEKTIEMRQAHGVDPDVRLIRRRLCEFEIFRSLEEAVELPLITRGFASMDEFITRAQTILQRRKARSGRSLELHAKHIFLEENLHEGAQFSHQPESERGKRPDFLFPSQHAYQTNTFPERDLRMLAVKTTCKDRWRQILNEADRIQTKHLLTLQEGVSENQFREMTEAGVQLVVPRPLVKAYPSSVQGHLQTLESFIGDVRFLGGNVA